MPRADHLLVSAPLREPILLPRAPSPESLFVLFYCPTTPRPCHVAHCSLNRSISPVSALRRPTRRARRTRHAGEGDTWGTQCNLCNLPRSHRGHFRASKGYRAAFSPPIPSALAPRGPALPPPLCPPTTGPPTGHG